MPLPAVSGLEAKIEGCILASLACAEHRARPFPNWRIRRLLPEPAARALAEFAVSPLELGGLSGRRELHNERRRYFAGEALASQPVALAVAAAFQSRRVVQAMTALTGALLLGTYLRIEYAADGEGFWLEPHTDLGVKAFTLLLQLGLPGQEELGTDLYLAPGAWSERVPFGWNAALAFVPSKDTWHGFEPRPMPGVRRSLIVNYVTEEWRAREQLAFPDRPIGA